MFKKLLCFALMLIILSSSTMILAEEVSTEKQLDGEVLNVIKEKLRTYNVSEDTIQNLIEKLHNGEIWDSLSGEYHDLEPQIVENGYSKTIYPDGSIKVEKVEITDETEVLYYDGEQIIDINNGEISILSSGISGGTVTSGSGYVIVRNARVYVDTVFIDMKFYADYDQLQNRTSKIVNVKNEAVGGLFFNISDINLSITNQNGSGDTAATARLRAQASSQFLGGSTTIWLQLNVTYNREWTTHAI